MVKKKEAKSDEIVEFDLSKLNPLKAKKAHIAKDPTAASSEEPSAEVSFDISSFSKLFSGRMLMLILLLIPVLMTVYFRAIPEDLPASDEWARNAVNNAVRNSLLDSVNKQFPNLPSQNKNELVNQQLDQALKEHKGEIDQQVQMVSGQFKQWFQDKTPGGKTYTYLGDLDSYYWLRYAENIVNKGSYCDKIVDGKCWDSFLFAPLGDVSEPTLHPYMIAFVYKIMSFFSGDVSILSASFYTTALGAVIVAIVIFFLTRRMAGDFAGFIASVSMSVNSLFLTRTLGSDNDIWSIALSLIIAWLALEAFEAKETKKIVILAALAGFFTGVFGFAWQGWWYMFDFLVIAMVGYVGFLILREFVQHRRLLSFRNRELQHSLLLLVVFFVCSAIFITWFLHWTRFAYDPLAPVSFSALKHAANPSLWPNVFTTVAELNPGSLGDMISSAANTNNFKTAKLYFLVSLLGVLLLLIKSFDKRTLWWLGASLLLYLFLISSKGLSLSIVTFMVLLILPVFVRFLLLLFSRESLDLKPSILLIIWYAGTAYATIKGVRFILIFLPAFSVAFGVALGRIIDLVSVYFAKDSGKKLRWSRWVLFLILLLFLASPVEKGWAAVNFFIPTIDKGWVDTLTKIKQESKPDAIINSWWDFGHWFKYWAQRRVTLDGATQNHPNAHWLGELMITPNEDESVAILRMLDCGNNQAFEEINKRLQDTEFSHDLLHRLILADANKYHLDVSKAEALLKDRGFTDEEIARILKLAVCDPPENFFITSEDMVGKAGVWGHFGLWNFSKAFVYQTVKAKSADEAVPVFMSRYGLSKERAEALYFEAAGLGSEDSANAWISSWPNYMSGNWFNCPNVSNGWACSVNFGLGSQNNQQLVLEKVVVNRSKGWDVRLVIGAYDGASGTRLGDASSLPNHFFVAAKTLEELPLNGSNAVNIAMLLDTVSNRVMFLDPHFGKSLFTKLFYLDGRYTSHFEKFSDKSTLSGSRILVWKVNWDGKKEA